MTGTANVQKVPVVKVAVVGAGTMGAGIAQTCAVAGHNVVLFDAQGGAVKRGLKSMETSLAQLVKKGTLTEADQGAALGRVTRAGEVGESVSWRTPTW